MSTQPKDSPFIRYCLNLLSADEIFGKQEFHMPGSNTIYRPRPIAPAHTLACSAAFQVYSEEYAKFIEATRDA